MIIYLHGFNSSGDSAKGKALQAALKNEIEVVTPTYEYDPSNVIAHLTEYILEKNTHRALNKPFMIMGSSLGGFYAQYLGRQFADTKVAMINPALGPIETLQDYLGENTNFYTQEKYILKQHHLDALKNYDIPYPCQAVIPTLLLIDKGDEVIDCQHAVDKYQSCGEIILYEGGDHQFQHLTQSLSAIKKFYFNT
jgi:predicted esterase YcpF (UPF0227 family)